MSGLPRAAEWEYLVEGDLAPHLVSRRTPDRRGLAAGIPRLPDGAHESITASLGPVKPEDPGRLAGGGADACTPRSASR
jgi:hypothetical protein